MQEIHLRLTFNCAWQRIRFSAEIGLVSVKRFMLGYPPKLITEKSYTLSKMQFSPDNISFYFALENLRTKIPPYGPYVDFLLEYTDSTTAVIITLEKSDTGLLKLDRIESGKRKQLLFLSEAISQPRAIMIPLSDKMH